jgi:hypothetical protein
MNVGETYLGLDGPFKGLYFKVIARDDSKRITTVKTVLYEKSFELSDEYVRDSISAVQII